MVLLRLIKLAHGELNRIHANVKEAGLKGVGQAIGRFRGHLNEMEKAAGREQQERELLSINLEKARATHARVEHDYAELMRHRNELQSRLADALEANVGLGRERDEREKANEGRLAQKVREMSGLQIRINELNAAFKAEQEAHAETRQQFPEAQRQKLILEIANAVATYYNVAAVPAKLIRGPGLFGFRRRVDLNTASLEQLRKVLQWYRDEDKMKTKR